MAPTLLIKHLPSSLSDEAILTLLKHYGAQKTTRMTRNPKVKNWVFAEFLTPAALENAKLRLNKVQFGNQQIQAIDADPLDSTTQLPSSSKGPSSLPPRAPLAPDLGLHFAPSPVLEYKYPAANPDIVTNIANALIAVPKFYTQVLHLMNKMNLPTPFQPNAIKGIFSHNLEQSIPRAHTDMAQATKAAKRRRDSLVCSDESELESEEEEQPKTALTKGPINPIKRKRVKPPLPGAFTTAPEPSGLATRPGVISSEELDRLRVREEEKVQYKVLQKYDPGEPNRALYVKNIAKGVTRDDLAYVFGFVFPTSKQMDTDMRIQYFTEGRMKGQAFIEFPTVDYSTKALERTHGLRLQDKPIVVVFKKQKPSS